MFFDKEWYNKNYPYGSIHSSRSLIINERGDLEEKPKFEKKTKKQWFRFRKKKKEKDENVASEVRSEGSLKKKKAAKSSQKSIRWSEFEDENIGYANKKLPKEGGEFIRRRPKGNEYMSRRARKLYNKSRLKEVNDEPVKEQREHKSKKKRILGPIINKSSDGKVMRLKIHDYDEPVPDHMRCTDRTCEHSEDEGRKSSWHRRKSHFVINEQSESEDVVSTDSESNKTSKSSIENESEDEPNLEPLGHFWYNILNMILKKESVKEVKSDPLPKKISKKISFADDTSHGGNETKVDSKVKSPRTSIMKNSTATSYHAPSNQIRYSGKIERGRSSEQVLNVEHYDQHKSKEKINSPTHSANLKNNDESSEMKHRVNKTRISPVSSKKSDGSSEIKYRTRKEGTLTNIKRAPSGSTSSESEVEYKTKKEGTLKNVKKTKSTNTNSTLNVVIYEETSEEEEDDEESTTVSSAEQEEEDYEDEDDDEDDDEEEDTEESSKSYTESTFVDNVRKFLSNFYYKMNQMFASKYRM